MKLLNKKEFSIPFFILFVFFMFYKPVICFLMLGVLAILLSILSWIFLATIQKNGIESIGKILSYEADEEDYKTPIIEFQTKNGNLIQKKTFYFSSTDISKVRTYKNKINTAVPVLYDPKNPERFVIANERKFNYLSLIFIILIGIVFLIFGTLSLMGIIQFEF